MKIRILGNGGAISDGLPYNSFIVDGHLLTETPPDVMNSLWRENFDISRISEIFISHFHADHFFGFPFLALRFLYDGVEKRIRIIGPSGIGAVMNGICAVAFGNGHPVMEWLGRNAEFIELRPGDRAGVGGGLILEALEMHHFIETIGYTIRLGNEAKFTYLSDTLWDDGFLVHLSQGQAAVLADMNGEPEDPVNIHMSERDIIEKVSCRLGQNTVFYGTHLKKNKESGYKNIIYIRPGDLLEV
ncbi:MAG: MBL fold metallo-hydrolase [Spirochaetes bacterium]|jgi:phosphoribosyl 1,2-cyclic phosphodiesterase|nr:MBL fold metallo-hydrolase [Spirochaetota bacterium]